MKTRQVQTRSSLARFCFAIGLAIFAAPLVGFGLDPAIAQDVEIVKTDTSIDSLDPGIKLFLREKMAAGKSKFTDDNIVLFLHGATSPSTCDFDLPYKDYSWADWLAKRGYVIYMGDYRNYGGSTREAAMDEPAATNQPLTRSYLALRDVEAMVDWIKAKRDRVAGARDLGDDAGGLRRLGPCRISSPPQSGRGSLTSQPGMCRKRSVWLSPRA